MSRQSLWKISITTSAEAEDAVANWLSEAFENDANIHHDFRSGKIVVSVFTENKPPSAIRARWREKRAQLKSFSINPGAGTLRIESVRRENWAESWKRHFKPIEIGDALLVKPSWIKRKTKRGQALVVLDPGLSFGTGQHPTTSFCLRELTRRRNAAQPQSFLDIGTGSGILAIAATKLGYAPVHAFDFDAESVRVARANAKRNRIADKISLARKDLTKLPRATPRRYDVVCANLISTLLISKRERIANRIKPNGLLIVAGILKSEFHLVQNAFEEIGFRLAARKQEKECPPEPKAVPPQEPKAALQQPPAPVDVEALLSGRAEQRVPMSRLRQRVAERLVQSQSTAAILTTFNEVNMAPVIELRKKYQERFEKEHGVRLGFMSFFVKSAVHALKRFPVVNASIDGSDIVYHGYFDIGVAVSSPRGLVVPILRDADRMSFAEIEKKIGEFGKRAQDGKLGLEELTGGTFSISNGGVFGSMLSTPIINPPQSAILGVHLTKERPVVENGQIVIRPMNYLALSYDHRIIDGREAVLFLVAIKEALEDPARLILEI